jgi:gluconate 2-dehydrogenase gamma chain
MHSQAEMDRRALMSRALLLVGATALPADVWAAKSRGRRRFLGKAQFALLSAIADTIIPDTDTPGAVAAGVPAKLDAMLRDWASAKRRNELMRVLTEIDSLAMMNDKKPFSSLSPDRRKALLVEHDKAALEPEPVSKEKLNVIPAMSGVSPVANPGYLKLKELVIALYYASEIASTKELVYEHVPGPWVPSLKVTPESRPFAGVGGFF